MHDSATHTSDPLVIDQQACRAYAREIREILGVDLFAIVCDATGSALWTDDLIRSDQLSPALRRVPPPGGEPRLQVLTSSWAVVEIPLRVASARALALRLIIHDEVRPNLEDVTSLTRQPVECLARQIEINSTLTASWLRPSDEQHPDDAVDDPDRLRRPGKEAVAVRDLRSGRDDGSGRGNLDRDRRPAAANIVREVPI